MKMVMRLAIVVATLLMVSNVAFAICNQRVCYDVTHHLIGDGEANCIVDFCLNDNGTGTACYSNGISGCAGCVDLTLFGGGPSWYNGDGSPAFGGKPTWTTWLSRNNLGTNLYQPLLGGLLLTGVSTDFDAATRTWISGKKIPCP